MALTNLNVKERMNHYKIAGLSIAVIQDGKLSCIKQYGMKESGETDKINEQTRFHSASISKFVTAMLVLKLVETGLLDLDEDVNVKLSSWHLTANKQIKGKKVTLRDLLSHQSGIIDPEGSFSEWKENEEVPPMIDILEGTSVFNRQKIQISCEPMSAFHYSDAGFCIIQQLIEDTLQKSFHIVLKEFLFQPLHMNQSCIDIRGVENISSGHDKKGQIVYGNYPFYPYPAACGIWTTPADLAILVLELMNALEGRSQLGLSRKNAKDIISPQGNKNWIGLSVFLDSSNNEVEISSLGWGIGFQSMLVAYPLLKKGAIIMTNTDLGVHQMKGIIGEIYHSIFGNDY
ncbi:penicillin-binding protein [Niallia circulans]|uniref:Penicillin-binding protein n=1 Tax=Niallia circulans TaxID=1397 RepID=A0A0J1IPC0_NIACI|nr:serine hydrolase domain-containing protein [Niallia circulans]KLV27824.1 penicillin-binding protein [Niallia circulans]MED5101356.1 serine hydrolase [Niallia circulans]NRG32838.1 beta-lactamase family protein [Niallia circulans]PAD87043.1 penicillin-binding protein [Niallia circulans]